MPTGEMSLVVWDVAHGACAMVQHQSPTTGPGRLAMIDSGCSDEWTPSNYIKYVLGRDVLDYLFITNADQDHMSDLDGLFKAGIRVETLHRNSTYTGAEFEAIKAQSGRPLTNDAKRYAALCASHVHPVSAPFNDYMGGITISAYRNDFRVFKNTNDLSLAVFVKFAGFKILFPGDLEKPGWRALLANPEFTAELNGLDILVASHHGRENGFCPEVFDYCQPSAVIISDKPIEHATQETVPDYRQVVTTAGVPVATTGKRRHVLTTRRDGWIQINVDANGYYKIATECHG
jgi:beta-lactamase superfamily II metal-dependent hydrolase